MQKLLIIALAMTACLFQDNGEPNFQDSGEPDWVPVSATPSDEELSIYRGKGEPALVIRRNEELRYDVEVDIGPFKGVSVGEARFKAWIVDSGDGEVGHIETIFRGQYMGFELDHRLHTRHLPTDDPALESFDTQRGSDPRRRQLSVLAREGVWTAVYRNDGHCKGCDEKSHFVKPFLGLGKAAHCKKCKRAEHRVWGEPRERAVPENALDFLSCIYLIRTLVISGSEDIATPLLDKDRLWNLKLTPGEKKNISVPLGKYACRHILIGAERPESESGEGKFSGLFGMKGTMRFWVHETTGALVQIGGELPLGPLDLGVKIRLKEAKNAPEGLKPLER